MQHDSIGNAVLVIRFLFCIYLAFYPVFCGLGKNVTVHSKLKLKNRKWATWDKLCQNDRNVGQIQ